MLLISWRKLGYYEPIRGNRIDAPIRETSYLQCNNCELRTGIRSYYIVVSGRSSYKFFLMSPPDYVSCFAPCTGSLARLFSYKSSTAVYTSTHVQFTLWPPYLGVGDSEVSKPMSTRWAVEQNNGQGMQDGECRTNIQRVANWHKGIGWLLKDQCGSMHAERRPCTASIYSWTRDPSNYRVGRPRISITMHVDGRF